MSDDKLNQTEIKMIQTIPFKKYTISKLASEMKLSLSWTSECISHLEKMEFVETEKKGFAKHVWIGSKPFCDNLLKIIIERPYLNLNHILADSKLTILSLLLEPGYRREDMVNRTSMSPRTITNALDLWRGMGIVRYNRTSKMYYIDPDQKYLNEFIISYNNHRSRRILKEFFHNAVIVWQWRDEFIFSIPDIIDNKNFQPAGFTRLDELRYDLLHVSQYYKFNPVFEPIYEEEALVQAVLIDPFNPRPLRLLNAGLKRKELDFKKISKYAKKYNIKRRIMKEVKMSG